MLIPLSSKEERTKWVLIYFFVTITQAHNLKNTPDMLGMTWLEADSEEEAKQIMDEIQIKRGSKTFAEHPYKIIDCGNIEEAEKRIYNSSDIIRKSLSRG